MKFSIDDDLVTGYDRRSAAASASSRDLARRIREVRDSIAEIERDARHRMSQPLEFGRKAPESLQAAMTADEVKRHKSHLAELTKLLDDDREADDLVAYARPINEQIRHHLEGRR